MIRLCMFRDCDPWHPPDSTGRNKIGLISTKDVVIYPLRSRVVRRPLAAVLNHRGIQLFERPTPAPDLEERVDVFIEQNVPNAVLLQNATKALLSGGDESFFEHPIRLPILAPISEDERQRKWVELTNKIQDGDLVQVFDSESAISRLIAKFDGGTWSHSAGYIGHGEVVEALTSGVTVRSLETYNDTKYRMGLYRIPGVTPEQAEAMRLLGLLQLGKPYAWRKVMRLALRKLIGTADLHRTPFLISPNDLVASARWFPVLFV